MAFPQCEDLELQIILINSLVPVSLFLFSRLQLNCGYPIGPGNQVERRERLNNHDMALDE